MTQSAMLELLLNYILKGSLMSMLEPFDSSTFNVLYRAIFDVF